MMEGLGAGRRGFIHVATFLPLKSWMDVVPFLRMSSKVLKQAEENEGAANYAVKADFPKKHFWTLSVWRDQDSLKCFVMAEPHATAVKNFERRAGEGSAFVEWTDSNDSIDWAEAMERLRNPSFYYRKQA